MRKAGRLLVLASFMAASASGISGVHRIVHAAGTLEIAEFQPFTGADASFGPEMTAGCDPAVYLINRAGGVWGQDVKCTAVDTRGDPADAVPAAQQLGIVKEQTIQIRVNALDWGYEQARTDRTGARPVCAGGEDAG